MNPDSNNVLRVIDPGFGASVQDLGRFGWRRFGIPASGCMDLHAADCANRLLENTRSAPIIEIPFGTLRVEMLQSCWIAIAGAAAANVPVWRAYRAAQGEVLSLRQGAAGVWSYLAVEGGFSTPLIFGSASCYARGGFGIRIVRGLILDRTDLRRLTLPAGVSGRVASWEDRRDYSDPPVIRVWPGPQWENFSAEMREQFFDSEWVVKPESDRVGYRLGGPKLTATPSEIISEPVRTGSIQVPENGQPIITMRDGPTVGGYPKIALVDEDSLSWAAQCRPGQEIQFELIP